MLPYTYDRPINLNRFPDGADRPGFWHKEVPGHAPDWMTRWHNDEADPGETEWYFVVDSVPALAWMANYGALELHPWTSRLPDVHQPTWALIDIDPGPKVTFDDVVVLARLYRTALEHLKVVGMPKVTGKRGIQIWVPIADGYTFAETRGWVEKVSRAVGNTIPELVSWEWETHRRGGLARLDYTQNAINKTLVAPFSARPAPGAPVSVPIEWDELDDPDLRPDRWTIRTVLDRLAVAGDPAGPADRPPAAPAVPLADRTGDAQRRMGPSCGTRWGGSGDEPVTHSGGWPSCGASSGGGPRHRDASGGAGRGGDGGGASGSGGSRRWCRRWRCRRQ